MKLEFRDNLKQDAIQLSLHIQDNVDRDVIVQEALIKWSAVMDVCSWGIEALNYELTELLVSIEIDREKLSIEVKSSAKKKEYICRIYEDVLEHGKWVEEEYAEFPINLVVEESPSSDSGGRSQVFVKYISLDLNSDEKKLILTI